MKKLITLLFGLMLIASVQAQTVYQIIQDSPDHTILEAAIDAANLGPTLSGAGPFTVFAPDDAAFNALGQSTIDALLADPTGDLTQILLYHVLGAEVMSSVLETGLQAETVQTGLVTVVINDDGAYINQAKVTGADLAATNGILHVIDAVITPVMSVFDVIANSPEHNILQNLLEITELDAAVSGAPAITVFAPTDDVFEDFDQEAIDYLAADPEGFLTRILLNHAFDGSVSSTDLLSVTSVTSLAGKLNPVVVDGADIEVGYDGAEVIAADIVGPNGMLHLVDNVLFPYDLNVDETIELDDRLTSLNSATEASMLDAPLADNMSGEDYTVFAPTNDAFGEIDQATLDALFADPTGDLANILRFHVVPDYLLQFDLENGDELETLQGKTLKVEVNGDGTFVNGAKIIDKDFIALNGAVHLIDKVLLPPDPYTVVNIIVDSDDHETLEAAVIAADLVGTLSGDGPFTVLAPTDDAFDALGQATIDALLADIPTLTTILTYHVVSGKVLSTDLANGTINMLSGESVEVNIDNGVVFNGTAMVTVADLPADNGIVHVIDAVLLPASVAVEDQLPNDYKFETNPNPASSQLTIDIEIENNNQSRNIELFDLTGKLLLSEKNVDNRTQLDVSEIANGPYYLRLTTSSGSAIRKIQILK